MPKFGKYPFVAAADGNDAFLIKRVDPVNPKKTKSYQIKQSLISGDVALNFDEVTDPASGYITSDVVDNFDGVVFILTAAGNPQTIADPTVTNVNKRFIAVNTTGSSDDIEVNTVVIEPGEAQGFVWDFSGWVKISSNLDITLQETFNNSVKPQFTITNFANPLEVKNLTGQDYYAVFKIVNSAGGTAAYFDGGGVMGCDEIRVNKAAIGIGGSPDKNLHVESTDDETGLFKQTNTSVSGTVNVLMVAAQSSGNMTNGFGPAIVFLNGDFTKPAENNPIGLLGYRKDNNNDESARFVVHTYLGGTPSERLTIDSNGFCGLGVSNPERQLHIVGGATGGIIKIERVNANSAGFIIQRSGTDTKTFLFSVHASSGENNGSFDISDWGGNEDITPISRIRIDNDGNVGINNSTPTSTLHVDGSIATKVTTFTTAGPHALTRDHHTIELMTNTAGADITVILPDATLYPGIEFPIVNYGNLGYKGILKTILGQFMTGFGSYEVETHNINDTESRKAKSNGVNWLLI